MSRTQRSFDRVERHKPRLGHGRAFVLPPRHRLFCILDEPWRLSSVLKAILEEPDIEVRDVAEDRPSWSSVASFAKSLPRTCSYETPQRRQNRNGAGMNAASMPPASGLSWP